MQSKNKLIAFALTVIAVLGGCASTGDLEALRDEINQANEAAQSASANADAASKVAAEAKAIAEEAKVSADEANSKIDNMFKKSMYK